MLTKAIRGSVVGRRVVGRDRLGGIGEYLLSKKLPKVDKLPSTIGFPANYKPMVEFVSVARDGEQTLGGNRFWRDPKFKDYIAGNSHIARQHRSDVCAGLVPTGEKFIPVTMGAEEDGGAGDQVGEVYFFANRGDRISQVRQLCAERDIRPLTRGVYGNLLVAQSPEDLKNQYTDSAVLAAGPHLDGEGRLVYKLFDSQGDPEKLRVPIEIIAGLRDQGYNVALETAMPVSADHDSGYYVDRMVRHALLAKEYGFTGEQYNSTCKDMAGEWDADRVNSIMPQVIKAISEEGIFCRHGIHAHDTGFAAQAYAAFISTYRTAYDEGKVLGPCTIDILQGTGIEDRTKGFSGFEETERALYEQTGYKFAVSESVRTMFEQQGKLWDEILKSNSARIPATSLMTDAQQRMWQVAGGARDSFPVAIERKKLPLNISLKESVELVGYALKKISPYIGKPSGVTPGFERKQNTTLNFIGNLIKAGLDYSSVKSIVTSDVPLTDEQISMIAEGLGDNEVKFFRDNEMPVPPHAIFSKAIARAGRDLPSASQIPDKLYDCEDKAISLLSSGLLRPSVEDARTALLALAHPHIGNIDKENIPLIIAKLTEAKVIFDGQPYGEEMQWHETTQTLLEKLRTDGLLVNVGDAQASDAVSNMKYLLELGAIQSGITKGFYLGPEEFHRRSKTPWVNCEPDPHKFNGNKDAYKRALARSARGLHPEPDYTEEMRNLYFSGKMDNNQIVTYDKTLREIERKNIENRVAQYVSQNPEQVAAALESGYSLRQCIGDILSLDRKYVDEDLNVRGRVPLFSRDRRDKISLSILNRVIGGQEADLGRMHEIVQELDSGTVRTNVAGTISQIFVKEGQSVKAGDVLAVVSAMKMDIQIKAPHSGEVGHTKCRVNDAVDVNSMLFSFNPSGRSEQILGKSNVPTYVAGANVDSVKSRAAEILNTNSQALEGPLRADLSTIHQAIVAAKADNTTRLKLTADEERGISRYDARPSLTVDFSMLDGYVPVIDNRGVAAAKAAEDYRYWVGVDPYILTTGGDFTTPVVKYAKYGIVPVTSHSVDGALEGLKRLQNFLPEGRRLLVERMYGFNSESAKFSDAADSLGIRYTGATGDQLRAVGSKSGFRHMLQTVAPELNVPFIDNHHGNIPSMETYCNNLSKNLPVDRILDIIFRREYQAARKIGDRVLIKANAGGGGRGQRVVKFDTKKSEEENYKHYLFQVLAVRKEADILWSDNTCETERMLPGNLRHLEVQLIMNGTDGGGMVAGCRDCTKQIYGQKDSEYSCIRGDLPDDTFGTIIRSGKMVADYLAKLGHKSVATLELLYNPDTGEIGGCEINDRAQVEHPVTEMTELGGKLSIPVANAVLRADETGTPPHKLLSRAFGLKEGSLLPAPEQMYDGTRILHTRLTARTISLVQGDAGSKPSSLKDDMIPPHLLPNLAKKYGVNAIMGGVGDGKSDSQFGTIYGKMPAVVNALAELDQVLPVLTESFERNPAAGTNVPFLRAMHPHMFDSSTGLVRPGFSISTCDNLFDAINKGTVTVVDAEGTIDSDKLATALHTISQQNDASAVPEQRTQATSLEQRIRENVGSSRTAA